MGMKAYNQFIKEDSRNAPLALAQSSGLQVDSDAPHQQICQRAQDYTRQRNQHHGQHGEVEMALVKQVRKPGRNARQMTAIGNDDRFDLLLGGPEEIRREHQKANTNYELGLRPNMQVDCPPVERLDRLT